MARPPPAFEHADERLDVRLKTPSELPLLDSTHAGSLGECLAREKPVQGLRRVLRDELGIDATIEQLLAEVQHSIVNRKITLYVFQVDLGSHRLPETVRKQGARWIAPSQVSNRPLSSLMRKVWVKIR